MVLKLNEFQYFVPVLIAVHTEDVNWVHHPTFNSSINRDLNNGLPSSNIAPVYHFTYDTISCFCLKQKKHGRQYSNRFIHLFMNINSLNNRLWRQYQSEVTNTLPALRQYQSEVINTLPTLLLVEYMYINILILFFTLRHYPLFSQCNYIWPCIYLVTC